MHNGSKKFSSNSFTGASKPDENTIVIDDDDEVVVVTSDVPANKGKANQDHAKPKPANNNQKRQQNQPQNQQRQQNQPQNQQRQQRPQQQFQNQREPSPSQELRQMFNRPNRNFQNQNSTQQQFQQRAQQFRMQQQQQEQQMQQRAPTNPWQVPDPQIRPFIHENPREQFMRPNQNNQFRQNNFNNQFDRFGPGGGGGNQYGGPNDLFNRERPHPMDNMDDYGMRRDNFNRGQPMFVDDPPLDRFQEPIPPWRQRSPFGQQQQQQQPMFNRRDDDDEFGNIPSNIPEEDLDEYIMRKQEMIKRRLEQLDKQLICSVESSRQHDMDMPPRRGGGGGRPGATVISHTGDVHFVPNPAAAARARNNNPRGRNNQGGAGRPNRPNDQKGGANANRNAYRNRNPFDDVEIVPIIRDRDGSPSPKRNREAGQKEDNFADRFNAAWS